jgi:hypothetical protein
MAYLVNAVKSVMGSVEGWDVYFHGTAASYERVQAGQGVLGVGLYLTDSPEMAAFYAETHAQQLSRLRTVGDHE